MCYQELLLFSPSFITLSIKNGRCAISEYYYLINLQICTTTGFILARETNVGDPILKNLRHAVRTCFGALKLLQE